MRIKKEHDKYAIAIDIGATRIRIGIGRVDGTLLRKVVISTSQAKDDLVNFLTHIIEEKFSRYLDKLVGIGIGSIGPLDINKGTILKPSNAPFENVEVRDPLSEKFNVNTYMVNDAVAAVWGEKIYGRGRSFNNIVYITISTGIGAGVIVDNHLLLGKDGNAHEVGHIVVDYEGKLRCGCGGYGHWEAYCSGANIPRFTRYLIETKYKNMIDTSTLLTYYKSNTLTSKMIFEHARQGDLLALRIVDEIALINASGVSSVVNCYDPELISFGGAVALYNSDLILNPLTKYMSRYVINKPPKLSLSTFGEDAVLKGAIALVFYTPNVLMKH